MTEASEVDAILARVDRWTGSREASREWYRNAVLPGFGGRTAEALVQEGKAYLILRYLDEVELGGFA